MQAGKFNALDPDAGRDGLAVRVRSSCLLRRSYGPRGSSAPRSASTARVFNTRLGSCSSWVETRLNHASAVPNTAMHSDPYCWGGLIQDAVEVGCQCVGRQRLSARIPVGIECGPLIGVRPEIEQVELPGGLEF